MLCGKVSYSKLKYWFAGLVMVGHATAASGSDFFTLKGHGGPIMGIAVEATSDLVATASFDNSVGIWKNGAPRWLESHRAAVNAVTFAGPDRLVSAGDDFAIVVWDLQTGEDQQLEGHKGKVMAIAVSPDTKTIASASWDGSIGLWPAEGGNPMFLSGHTAGVNDVAFAPTGQQLYSASVDGTIRLWDLKKKTQEQVLLRHGFGINSILLDAENGWLAYGAVDGVTRIVDPGTGQSIADFSLDRRPILALAANADRSLLAVGDGEGYILIINTQTWKIARDFRATLRGPIWALAFSNDGENIHAGGLDDAMYSWPILEDEVQAQMASDTPNFQENPALLSNGERQFKRKCSICHSLTTGSARRAGPTLHQLFGRRAGTVPDYSYSETLTGSDIIWNDVTIDSLFDLGPDHFIPGTKMPMQRITAQHDRDDLIDYLRVETTQQDQ